MLNKLGTTQLIQNTFSAQSSDSWGKYMNAWVHEYSMCNVLLFKTTTKSPSWWSIVKLRLQKFCILDHGYCEVED